MANEGLAHLAAPATGCNIRSGVSGPTDHRDESVKRRPDEPRGCPADNHDDPRHDRRLFHRDAMEQLRISVWSGDRESDRKLNS
jgi:hypothetical protein